ncbi:MAG: hypothetical protein H3C58_13940 [Fimbriimonadaceae bacterium]|nr:hypothetical protein [Fimbriimonadaceae bacterium]
MKFFPFVAISALGSALTGGWGHHSQPDATLVSAGEAVPSRAAVRSVVAGHAAPTSLTVVGGPVALATVGDPIVGLGFELGMLALASQQSNLSEQERQSIEKRIAELEAKIEKLAAKIEQRMHAGAVIAPDSKVIERLAQRGEAKARSLSPKDAEAIEKLAQEMAKRGEAMARTISPQDAKAMEELGRKMAEEAKSMARVYQGQDMKLQAAEVEKIKAMAKEHAEKARSMAQEIRVKVLDESKVMREQLVKELAIAEGAKVRILERGKDGQIKGWIKDEKDAKMREMTSEELEQWRKKDLGDFTGKSGLFGFEFDGPARVRGKAGDKPQMFEFKFDRLERMPEIHIPNIRMPERAIAPLMKLHELKELGDIEVTIPKMLAAPDGKAFFELGKAAPMDKEMLEAIRELREEIAKLRKELASKGGKTALAPVTWTAAVMEPQVVAGFEAFGKLQKGWRVPTAGSMEGLFESLTDQQLGAHDQRGYLTLDDLTPQQKASLGDLDFLPWELTLTLNGRKLNIRATATRSPEFTR